HFRIDDVRRGHALARLERPLDGAAGLQVADPHAIECLALAGLHELVLDDHAGIAVEDDLEAGTEFAGAVVRHGKSFRRRRIEAAYDTGCLRTTTGSPPAAAAPKRR